MVEPPLSYGDIEWAEASTEWPIPDTDWPGPSGYFDSEDAVRPAPPDFIEDALDTARTWYPQMVGRRRDACLLTFTDFFERHLAGELARTKPARGDETSAHSQAGLDEW